MAYIQNWNPPKLNANNATFYWDVDYASDVHEGVISNNKIMPARPWTDDALARTNVVEEFRQAYIDREDLQGAFNDTVSTLFHEFHVSMLDEKWKWSNITKRKSGEVVGSPRDIYDTGELYRSQKVAFGDMGVGE